MVDVGQGKVIRQGRSRGLLVAACCGLSALFIIVAVCNRTILRTLWRIQGYAVNCRDVRKELDVLRSPKGVEVGFDTENLTDADIVVAGARSSCPCVTPLNLPLRIPAGETAVVLLSINVIGNEPSRQHFMSSLFFSPPAPSPALDVEVRYHGEIASSGKPISPMVDPEFSM